jgi:hypothetical protein
MTAVTHRLTFSGHSLWSTALRLVAVVGIALNTVLPVFAQDDHGIVTPTPAPSKTPSSVDATPTNTITPEATRVALQSLTQTDLRVLTGNVQRPNAMTLLDGKLYVSCTGDWTIYQLDDTTGQTITYIYGVRNAHTLYAEMDASNEVNLWVPDFQSNTVSRVTRNGIVPIASQMNGPWGIAHNTSADSFLVSNLLSNNVVEVKRDGTVAEAIRGLTSPTGVVIDEQIAYVANNGSTRRAIEWYDLSQSWPVEAPAGPNNGHALVSGLQNATGLQLGPDGYLYFAYSLGTRGTVGRVNPDECRASGGCTGDQVEVVVRTELASPIAGLTISPDNRVYLHTMYSPDIYWFQLPGTSAE